ncbi:MAG: hypothetical protein IKB05_05080 [Alphaproteobacteria bacterium]|nr:hypothetical protein [Alphaproteobacteria bacterium]
MNKLLKLTGVSMLAIVAATGARAAGYTCEELIEYTSCNTGYALLDGDCVCDGGYYTNGDKCTICPIGTYSSVNASECTTCPTTGLVDPNNNAIVATTASTGSKNISACIIPTNVTIKGETGLYHFKSSCAYSGLTPGVSGGGSIFMTEQAACEADASGTWNGTSCDCDGVDVFVYSNEIGTGVCTYTSFMDAETVLGECTSNGGTWNYATGLCDCPYDTVWLTAGMSYGDVALCSAVSLNTADACTAAGGWFEEWEGNIECSCQSGGWKKDANGNYICEQ